MVTVSPSQALLADTRLHAAAQQEGEFPLFVFLAILAVLAVMAVAAARSHTDAGSGRYRSNRHETAPRSRPEPLGHPLDRIDTF